VAAGSGIAIVPRSVLAAMHAESLVKVLPLPRKVAQVRTHLIWRIGHRSVALEALRKSVPRNDGGGDADRLILIPVIFGGDGAQSGRRE
jgi:DNA-binding transcriptional LysR family regulator